MTTNAWRFHGAWDARLGRWHYIYKTATQVRMTGTREAPVPLDLVEVDAPTDGGHDELYWGWLPEGDEVPTMIWAHRRALDICFPSGVDRAIELGRGRIVRLAIAAATDDQEAP